MKCKLKKDGNLVITSETDLEEFALNQWEDAKEGYRAELTIEHQKRSDKK